MSVKQGRYTLMLPSAPGISGYAAVVGKKEGEGLLFNFKLRVKFCVNVK